VKAVSRLLQSDYLGLLVVLAALFLVFGTLSDRFLTLRTFTTVANQVPDLAVIAVGMTFVLIVGGIDLSVGSVLALAGALLGVGLAEWSVSLGSAAAMALLAGLHCGFLNGFVSVFWSVPSFIVTLGMLEIARGAAYLVTGSRTAYIGAAIEPVGAPLPGLGLSPAFLAAIVLVIAGQLALSRTVFGRYAVAIGTNEEAVRLSGIDPRPTRIVVFALAGLLSGLGGVFHSARLAAADPNAAVGLELSAIAAVVLGGTSLMGGRGSVVRSFFGVLVIAVLQSGLAQIGASEPAKRVVTGAVIVAAVIADSYRSSRLRGND
jgi:ribose transport system permease protein